MEYSQWWAVSVPTALVRNQLLSVGAKALYMVMLDRYKPGSSVDMPTTELVALAGCKSPQTADEYLRQLAKAGWLEAARVQRGLRRLTTKPISGERTVRVPGLLVSDPTLRAAAKCLYAMVAMHRDIATGTYKSRLPDLPMQKGLANAHSVQAAIKPLLDAGWLQLVTRSGRGGRTYMTLDPHLQIRQAVLNRVQQRIERHPYLGEAIFQAMLTELITDRAFHENARLGEITSPVTGEHLEFDRLYTNAKVAIEFNGPQHYTTTERFPDPDALFAQQTRDLMKEAQAARHGYTLVVFEQTELRFATMAAKLDGLLPLQRLRATDPVVRELERLSAAYRRKL